VLHLAPLDVGVLVAYLAGVLALGFSARLRDSSILQYLTAGRALSLPAFVATLVATWYGGVLGSGDMVKFYGVGAILLNGVPYYLFAILYAAWWAPRVRAADQISIPERLHLRYGKGAALVGAALVFLLAAPAAHIFMLGKLLGLATGWSLPSSVVLAALVSAVFLFRGGLLADVRASLLAFVMMYVGFVVLVLACLSRQPLADLWNALPDASKSPSGGQGILSVLTFFALGAWTLIDPGFHQRAASAATPATGRRGVLVSVVFWMLFDLLTTLAGLYAIVRMPKEEGVGLFPLLGDLILAPGLKGVFLCGLFGTILSATVGYTLVAGATFGREVLGRLRPEMDDHRVKAWTRFGFLVSGILAATLALSVNNVAVDLWYAYAGAVTGALLPPLALAYGRERKIPGTAAAWAMALGFAVAVAWIVQAKRTNNTFLLVKLLGEEFSLGTLIPAAAVSSLVLILGISFAKRETTR
jgi:SSS family solute:Na+ symporter